MSHLWDDELAAEEPRVVAALAPPQRLLLAFRVLAWTVASLDPPVEDAETSAFVADGLRRIEEAVGRGAAVADGAAEMRERFWENQDEAWEAGAAPLRSATVLCFSERSELRAKTVMALLNDCYEAVLERATGEAMTPEVERATPRAVEAVEFQKALIRGDRLTGGRARALLRDHCVRW